jgi:hypothetical protein
MIVSLTQICCPSDLKKERTLTVYQNVSQYNNQEKHSHDSGPKKTVDVLFYLRSDGQYVLISDAIMGMFLLIIILCDVLMDSDCSFLLKVRWTYSVTT